MFELYGPPTATSTDELAEIDMKAVYKKSTVNLKEILKNPGVWDPFILCYVEVSSLPVPAIGEHMLPTGN